MKGPGHPWGSRLEGPCYTCPRGLRAADKEAGTASKAIGIWPLIKSVMADAQWIHTRRFGRERTPGNRLADWYHDNGLPPPRVVASVESLFDSLSLVAQTDFLFLAPSSVLQDPLIQGALSAIAVQEAIPPADICLVQRVDVPLAPAAAKLARILLSYASLTRHRAAV